MAARKRFQPRAFTTTCLACTGSVLALTGLVCYFKPPSRISEWIGWRFLGLEKGTWEALHTVFALLFVIAAAIHLWFNRRPLLTYLLMRLRTGRERWREMAAALGLTAAFILITMLGIFPAGPIMELSDRFSEGWGGDGNAPLIARIEKFPLATYCRLMEIDLATAIRRLEGSGLEGVTAETPVREIALENGLPPIEIGRLLETALAEP
jgi:hypothetical protein